MPATYTFTRTTTCTHLQNIKNEIIQIDWIADTGGACIIPIAEQIQGYLMKIQTKPGTPAPSGVYGVTLVDSFGADVLQGLVTSRSVTAAEEKYLTPSGSSLPVFTLGLTNNYTLNVTGNATTGAKGSIRFFVSDGL